MKTKRYLHIVLMLAALIASGSAGFAASTSELLQQGLYAEEVEGNIDSAIKTYQQIIENPSAPANHVAQALYRQGMCYLKLKNDAAARAVLTKLVTDYSSQTEIVEKARPLLDEVTDFDPASLMPPNTLVYVEFGSPGRQVETILDTLKGTPFENPLAAVGGGQQRNSGSNEKTPADIVGALLNPGMTAEFKKIRSSAIGITGVALQNPPMIAVLYPGKSDALRGVILAALGMAGKPGEPMEGMQTVKIQAPNNLTAEVAYDDRIIIAAQPASQLEWCVKEYKGLISEPTLASSSKSFARIGKTQRQNNVLTAWANVDELYAKLPKVLPGGRIPPGLVAANAFVDFPHIDDVFITDSVESNGLATKVELQFKDGHHCLGYDLIRTPNIRKAALEAVPANAIALASFALNPSTGAQMDAVRAKLQNITGLDLGREVFANLEQVVLFAMPAEKGWGEPAQKSVLPGRFGLALTSRNPEQTRQVLTTLLSSADVISEGGPAAGTGKFKISNANGTALYCYFDQVNTTTLLSLDPNVLAASVTAIKSHKSVVTAGALSASVDKLTPSASKLVLVNVGGAVRSLAPRIKPGELSNEQSEQWSANLDKLAQAADNTTVELRTDEQPNNFSVNACVTGLPPLQEVIGPAAQIARIAKEASAEARARNLRNETPAIIFPAAKAPGIDGEVDEAWARVPINKLENVVMSFGSGEKASRPSSPEDLSADFRAMWDSDNLYLLVDVTDDKLVNDTDPVNAITLPSGSQAIPWWYDDSIEVYLDADNAKTAQYGAHDAQFRFNWGEKPVLRVYNQNTEIHPEGVKFAMVKTDKGYRLETSIPWKDFAVKPSAGATVGLDVEVNDDDDGGARDSKITWHDKNDNAWQNPQTFGNAVLGGLVGWWKFDETEGKVAHDNSGGNHNGTLIGDAKWAQGKLGGAIDLNGRDSYVRVADKSAFNMGNEVTIACWVNFRSVDHEWAAIVTKGDSAWRLSAVETQRKFHVSVNDWDKVGLNGQTEVPAGQWHQVVAVYDGKNLSLYVDGKLDGTQAWAGGIGKNDFNVLIGENAQQKGRFFDGLIDDVRVYNYALAGSDIARLAAQPVAAQ